MTLQLDRFSARILVIDDEQQNLLLLCNVLDHAGYRNVRTVRRSSDAVEQFIAFEPDLILLDLHMPAPDGFAVMAEVRSRLDPADFLPILVLSADASQQAKQHALAIGATDFVAKPLQVGEVLLRIQNLIETRAVHQELRVSHASMTAELAVRHGLELLETQRIQEITDRVQLVLDTGGPTMVFQPIVELPAEFNLTAHDEQRGHAAGVEALARFEHLPVQGPDHWFRDATEIGLGVTLEMAAIIGALRSVNSLPPATFLSLNASSATMCSDVFQATIEEVDGSKLVVELTEHERVEDYDRLARAVRDLHDRGARLAVDDTGAGFSSLQHIVRLEPDIVKLDRNLIVGVDQDPIRRSMVAAMVHFSSETDTMLIAEGIETPSELEALCRLGVRHGQGYHLARPTDFDATFEGLAPSGA